MWLVVNRQLLRFIVSISLPIERRYFGINQLQHLVFTQIERSLATRVKNFIIFSKEGF